MVYGNVAVVVETWEYVAEAGAGPRLGPTVMPTGIPSTTPTDTDSTEIPSVRAFAAAKSSFDVNMPKNCDTPKFGLPKCISVAAHEPTSPPCF
jgi:hypothetical protein